jgi:hypothetical protein
MFTDLYGFKFKAEFWAYILEKMDKDLPSYRDAKIHVAHLGRLTKKFEREFPTDLLETMPAKQLRKKRGQFKKRVAEQDKLVNKSIRKVIEDAVVRQFPNIPRKKIRGHVQEYVLKLNRDLNRETQLALEKSYAAVRAALSGHKLSAGVGQAHAVGDSPPPDPQKP